MATKAKQTGTKDSTSLEVPDSGVEVSSPTGEKSLDELRMELETGKLSREQREELLLKSLKKALTLEATGTLTQMVESGEVTPENSDLLRNITAYLLALALYTEVEVNSVQDLITEYRSHKDESLRFISQVLIKIVAKNDSPLGEEFQSTIWDEAKEEAVTFVAAMHEVEALHEQKTEEEVEQKVEKKTDSSWYEAHKNEVNTALILGGLGVGIYWLTNKLFKKENGQSGASTGTKVALAGIVGAFGLGQVLGFESVQTLISGGKSDSWVYKPWVRGLVSAADLELGTAMDFWTGNGPSEAEQTMFEQMSAIFGVSDSRLWGTSKLGFYEFMDGKNASMLPWYTDDEEKLRTKIKDFYLEDLEKKLPYLKDKDRAKSVTLKEVLIDGFKLGVIKEKDTTGLKEGDRAATAEREAADEEEFEAVRAYFDHPEENLDELKETGENMVEDIDKLDQSTDQYWNDVLVGFENMIGVDFDLGEDDSEEYRDLKQAREILHATFEEAGIADHEFFSDKRKQVKAFLVFLEKHKDEEPWSAETVEEYETYKSEMLELNQRIRASISRAELSNLQQMEKDRSSGEIIEDTSEFLVVGVCGALHYLNFRMEKLSEGNNTYIALTIAQSIGVASEFVDIDLMRGKFAIKPVNGPGHAIWKIGKGATYNLVKKPLVWTGKILVGAYHLKHAYRYSAEQMLEQWLKGELTTKDVDWRSKLAEDYGDYYKSRWIRFFGDEIEKADKNLKKIAEFKKFTIYEKEFGAFMDGKITIDGIRSDDAAEMLKNFLDLDNHPEKLQEIRFYRAMKVMRQSPHFNGLIEHLKDSSKPLSAEGRALFETLNDKQQTCIKELLKTEKGKQLLAGLVKASVLEYIPQYLGPDDSATESAYKFNFGKEEYSLKHTDIARKAGEIADAESLAGRGPEPGVGGKEAWNTENWNKATKILCEERFARPVAVPGKPDVYKLAGEEFKVDPTEVTRRTSAGLSEEAAVRSICIEQGTAHLAIEEMRMSAGRYEYKIGGEWVALDDPSIPAKQDQVRAKFEEVIGKQDKAFDFAKFAKEAKTLKFFGLLNKIMGTVGAVMTIYHLETAPDKRKAVCEVMAGVGTFIVGMRAADWKIGSKIKSPGWRLAVDLGGGFAASFGLTEPISSLMASFFESIPSAYAVSEEVSDIFEKVSYRMLIRGTVQSIEKGVIKKGVEKMGFRALEVAFEKKISSVFLQKVGRLAARQGFKQVLKALGWKGVTTAALLADDATVVGVVDDIVAAGLVVWMGFDIVDIITLIANAVELEKNMEERKQHEIISFDIKDAKSRAAFQEKLIPFGLTIDKAHELPEETFFDILRTLPSVRVEFKRKDTLGSEVWTLSGGEATGIAIYDEKGKVHCEINDEDAVKMEEALDEMEAADSKVAD